MLWTIIATVGGWIVRRAVSGGGSSVLEKVIGAVNKGMDGNIRLAQINAETGKVVYTKHADTSTDRQREKMNWPVFWVIICAMMLWPFVTLGAITLYNIFWWEHGIWPQDWAIAAYPPSVAPWVEKSIDWLYDPLGAPTAVGTASAVGWLTRRRK